MTQFHKPVFLNMTRCSSIYWTNGDSRLKVNSNVTWEIVLSTSSIEAASSTPEDAAGFLLPGTAAYRRTNFALFCAGFATFSLMYCVQPLLPVFSEYFGISPARSSLSLSLTTGCLALSILVVGLVSQRLPRKRLMGASLLASGVLTVACAMVPHWGTVLLLRALIGIAIGGVPAIAMAYLAEEMHAAGLGLAMGLYIGGSAFGGMAGRVITGYLADAFNWRIAMSVSGYMGLVAAVAFLLLLPESRRFSPSRSGGIKTALTLLGKQLTHPGLFALYALGFLLMGSFVTVYNYTEYRLLAAPYKLSQTVVGAIFAVYLVGIAASALFGRLADRYGRERMLLLGSSIMTLGLALTMLHALFGVVLGITLLTFGFFAAHSVASSAVGKLSREAKAQAASLYLLAYYLGSSVMGFAGGVFWTHAGWAGVGAFTGIAMSIALLISWRLGSASSSKQCQGAKLAS